jgi:hypothetical protein
MIRVLSKYIHRKPRTVRLAWEDYDKWYEPATISPSRELHGQAGNASANSVAKTCVLGVQKELVLRT